MRVFIFIIVFFVPAFSGLARDLYWSFDPFISGRFGQWDARLNWARIEGGAGILGNVPGPDDVAIFSNRFIGGFGNCEIPSDVEIGGLIIESSYRGTIDVGGHTINVTSGSVTIDGHTDFKIINGSIVININDEVIISNADIQVDLTVRAPVIAARNSVFTDIVSFEQTGSGGTTSFGNTFNAICQITNSGFGSFKFGDGGADNWNADLTLTNSGSGNLHIANSGAGTIINGNVLLANNSQGIYFGDSGGDATLLDGNTITAETENFDTGYLYFKNFTQEGNTPQHIDLSGAGGAPGNAKLYLDSCTWEGNTTFTAAQIFTENTLYKGTSVLRKTGSGTDISSGGNIFSKASTLENSGSGNFTMGSASADIWNSHLSVLNSGSGALTIANDGTGHRVDSLLIWEHSGSGNSDISSLSTASLTVAGKAQFINSSESGNLSIGIAGDIHFQDTLEIQNASYVNMALDSDSDVAIDGPTSFIQSGANSEIRGTLGDSGDIVFNGTLAIANTATSSDSEINLNSNSNNLYNNHITVESTNNSKGIFFGNNGGTATLTTDKTITAIPNKFDAGDLRLQNFTQVGITSQSIELTGGGGTAGSARIYLDSTDWDADVTLAASRIYTANTTYNRTSLLKKTGSENDFSPGGNTFVGIGTLENAGSGSMIMGATTADDWQAGIKLINSGSDSLHIAYADIMVPHTLGVNVQVASTNPSSKGIFFGYGGGSVTLTSGNTITAETNNFVAGSLYFKNFTQQGNTPQIVELRGAGEVGTAKIYLENSEWNGNVVLTAPGIHSDNSVYNNISELRKTGSSYDKSPGGNTFVGRNTIENAGPGTFIMGDGNKDTWATTSEITLINSGSDSLHIGYSDAGELHVINVDVKVSSHTSSKGIFFGAGGGAVELIAGKRITVDGVAFDTGDLSFTNFTQQGGTAQNLILNNTARIYNKDSDWGGNVNFEAPRVYTENTTYRGASSLKKTGSSTDISPGNNTFLANSKIENSGSGDLIFGDGEKDEWQADLELVNTGSESLHIGYSVGAGGNHTVAGTIIVTSTGSSKGIFFGDNGGNTDLTSGNSVSVGGGGFSTGDLAFNHFVQDGSTAQSLTLTGTARMYHKNADWGGNVTFEAPRIYTENTTYRSTSSITKTGSVTDTSPGGNLFVGDSKIQLTSAADFILGDGERDQWQAGLELVNTGSESLHIGYSSGLSGDHTIGGAITVTGSSTSKGIFFGSNGGSTVLASGNVITIGIGGFSGGDLAFTNFTQTGSTTQNLTLTGTARIYSKNADWGGEVNFEAPRIFTESTTYRLTSSFTKTGNIIDASPGGNIFVGNCKIRHTGSQDLILGDGTKDEWRAGLELVNAGSAKLHIAYTSDLSGGRTTITNNLTIASIGSSGGIFFGDNSGVSELSFGGSIVISDEGFSTGDLSFANFSQLGNTAQNLTITGTAEIRSINSSWGGEVRFEAPGIYTANTTYESASSFVKTGGTDSSSPGGNIFKGNAVIEHRGTDRFIFGDGIGDTWEADLTVKVDTDNDDDEIIIAKAGSGHLVGGDIDWQSTRGKSYLAYDANASVVVAGGAAAFTNAGTRPLEMYIGFSGDIQFYGNIAATQTNSGRDGSGLLVFAENNDSQLNITGDVTLTNNSTSTGNEEINFGFNGDITLNGDLTMDNSNARGEGIIALAGDLNSLVTINGTTSCSHPGTSSDGLKTYMGDFGDVIFNGTVNAVNNSNSANSLIYFNHEVSSQNTYNGNLVLKSTAGANGIFFGENRGSATLSATASVSGGGDVFDGDLTFQNMQQSAPTPSESAGTLSITLDPSNGKTIGFIDTEWYNTITCEAPGIEMRNTICHGAVTIEKTGSFDDQNLYGNTFNGDVIFVNSGTGGLRLAASGANDFNGNATFRKLGSGLIEPSFGAIDTYAGSIAIDADASITFSGVMLDGNSDQQITVTADTPEPLFDNITIDKAGGVVTLQTPATVTGQLTLTNGIINTTDTDVLTIANNATVSGASVASFVNGPIEKLGDDAFEFPVGADGFYRPIGISAPLSTGAGFRAQYFQEAPGETYPNDFAVTGIHHISGSEFWILDRVVSSDPVEVTLSWLDATSGEVTDLDKLTVARWDGTKWTDHGNGGTTGTLTSGTIRSSGAITDFSPFTLASLDEENPLPVELISFRAKSDHAMVDLSWITAVEINSERYEIEKSTDGENWTYLTTVAGSGYGTIAGIRNYKVRDETPYYGQNYYRLTQYDIDGTSQILGVAFVEVFHDDRHDSFAVYPNPSAGEFHVVANQSELNTIKVYNVLGREVIPTIKVRDNLAVVNLSAYEGGIYYIRTRHSQMQVILRR